MTDLIDAPTVTDGDLSAAVKAGDHVAALELFLRYSPHISRLAARHGTHVAFDREDVTQECFIQVVQSAMKSAETGEPFARVFVNMADNAIAEEAAKYRHPVPIPLWTFRLVHSAVKDHDGNAAAARKALANHPESWRRVSPETFDAIWLLAFGVHLEWSEPVKLTGVANGGGTTSIQEVIADHSTTDAFASIENQDYVRYLLDLVEHGLGPQAREVLARTYGLEGYPAALWDAKKDAFIAASSAIVAAEMGVHEVTVRRVRSRAIAYLQIHAEEI